jgi:hypothetical protein
MVVTSMTSTAATCILALRRPTLPPLSDRYRCCGSCLQVQRQHKGTPSLCPPCRFVVLCKTRCVSVTRSFVSILNFLLRPCLHLLSVVQKRVEPSLVLYRFTAEYHVFIINSGAHIGMSVVLLSNVPKSWFRTCIVLHEGSREGDGCRIPLKWNSLPAKESMKRRYLFPCPLHCPHRAKSPCYERKKTAENGAALQRFAG